MSVSPTTSLSSLPEPGGAPRAPDGELGKDDFLRLLTAQLRAQDPLSPMDSQAFVAQLAQFASVEQLGGLGKRLDTLLVAQASQNGLTTASLVGREVLYQTDRISLGGGGPAAFQVALADGSAETAVIISDESGHVVRTLDLGAREAGRLTAAWDGLDEAGHALPPGDYFLTVAAVRGDGTAVGAETLARGGVTGVSFDSGVPQLLVGRTVIALSDVLEISIPTP